MIKVMPVFFSCGPNLPLEEVKIRAFLIKQGWDVPTASRYAKVANQNEWTLEFMKLLADLAHNNDYINSNNIHITYGFSPNDIKSPIAIKMTGYKEYKLLYFLGSKNCFSNTDAQAIIRHEIRHVKMTEYYKSILVNGKNISLKSIIQNKSFEMCGKKANDISKRFFDSITLNGTPITQDDFNDYISYIQNIMEETVVWANATDKELDVSFIQKYISQPITAADKEKYLDKVSEARVMIGLAYFKALFDKHKVKIDNASFNKYLNKYQNSDIFKNSYEYIGLCIDVSRKYFPK